MHTYICSDVHKQYKWYVPSESPDCILVSGDMTEMGKKHNEHIAAYDWLRQLGDIAPTYWVPGNHDWYMSSPRDIDHENVHLVLYSTHVLPNGMTITGASMSPCYDIPNLAIRFDNMTCNWKYESAYYDGLPKAEIVLSHCPPWGQTGNTMGMQLGSKGLLEYVNRVHPRYVICGHIHEPDVRHQTIGVTKVINTAIRSSYIEL